MPEYEMRLRFTAASDTQAERLAEAWAGTCAAEYGTTYCGFQLVADAGRTAACEWCGRAIQQVDGASWWAVKGEERGYHPPYCDANPHHTWHSPSARGT